MKYLGLKSKKDPTVYLPLKVNFSIITQGILTLSGIKFLTFMYNFIEYTVPLKFLKHNLKKKKKKNSFFKPF